MKKNILVLGTLALMSVNSITLRAQSQMEALHLGTAHKVSGSARYQALGGAMGAVGVDYSSTAQNPAGIALFRSGSKVALTGYYASYDNRATWQDALGKKSNVKSAFDEFSYLTSWGSGVKTFTLGLAVRNGGRFRHELDASTAWNPKEGNSLADYAAARLNRTYPIVSPSAMNTTNDFTPYSRLPWIGVLGYNAGWVNQMTSPSVQWMSAYGYVDNGTALLESPSTVGLKWLEQGGVASYEVALAANLGSSFSLGGLLTYTSLDYDRSTYYSEGFRKRTDRSSYDGLSLDNRLEITGSGWGLSLGALYQPVKGLRLGLSVFTPQFYRLKIHRNSARATGYNASTINNLNEEVIFSEQTPDDAADALAMHTPWRIVTSAAYVFGRKAILSADYEYTNYAGMRLGADYGDEVSYSSDLYSGDNEAIRSDFGASHTLRLGLEYNLSKRLAVRAGYYTQTAPAYSNLLNSKTPQIEALVTDAQVHYSLPQGSSAFSFGLGYRLNSKWTLDLALSSTVVKSEVYAFPAIKDEVRGEWLAGLSPITYTQQTTQATLTLSYRY